MKTGRIQMDKNNSTCSTLVLLSGGIDSSALVQFHIAQGDRVEAIFFDYGQPGHKQEFLSAKAISENYGVQLHYKKLGFVLNNCDGEFYGRNGLFILAACSFIESPSSLISIGIHSGTPFYDSTPTFIKDIQKMLDGYFGGTIRVIAPFLDYSKEQVYKYAIQSQVPIELTYSCEVGKAEACGDCHSCIDRRLLDGVSLSENSQY